MNVDVNLVVFIFKEAGGCIYMYVLVHVDGMHLNVYVYASDSKKSSAKCKSVNQFIKADVCILLW